MILIGKSQVICIAWFCFITQQSMTLNTCPVDYEAPPYIVMPDNNTKNVPIPRKVCHTRSILVAYTW